METKKKKTSWRDKPATDGQKIFLMEKSTIDIFKIARFTRGEAYDAIEQIKAEEKKSREQFD